MLTTRLITLVSLYNAKFSRENFVTAIFFFYLFFCFDKDWNAHFRLADRYFSWVKQSNSVSHHSFCCHPFFFVDFWRFLLCFQNLLNLLLLRSFLFFLTNNFLIYFYLLTSCLYIESSKCFPFRFFFYTHPSFLERRFISYFY